MYIDKYKRQDGHYYDEHGGHYGDAESFIETHLLHLCGCGNPAEAREYVRRSLELVDMRKKQVWQEEKLTFKEWLVLKQDHFKSDGAELFMWYYLDTRGFTEHGSVVPGWLTADGEELLSDLNELKLATKEP